MEVKNKLYPSRDQMKGFFEVADDEDNDKPIYKVNLLKFKKKAEYRDGRKTNLTGIEAYQKYAEIITKHIQELGGEITFSSKIKRMTVGKVEDLWDVLVIAKWPSKKIMGENMNPSDPALLEGYQHREAGLEGQLNIESVEMDTLINLK